MDTWASHADNPLFTARSILQGLTPAEIQQLSLTVEHIEQMGLRMGWSEEQVIICKKVEYKKI